MDIGVTVGSQDGFFFARFLSPARFSRASFFNRSALGTVSTMLSALLMRSDGVFPGTLGAGSGFMAAPS